jgi:proline iminopeptidase
MPRWIRECAELRAELPPAEGRFLDRHEPNGWTDCPSTRARSSRSGTATSAGCTRGPRDFERSFVEAGYEVYHTMIEPSEFTVTGTLKDWDVTDPLGEIDVPTLAVGAEHDDAVLRTWRRSGGGSADRSLQSSAMPLTCAFGNGGRSSWR